MLRSREINLSFFSAGYGDRTRTAGMSGEHANHYTTNSTLEEQLFPLIFSTILYSLSDILHNFSYFTIVPYIFLWTRFAAKTKWRELLLRSTWSKRRRGKLESKQKRTKITKSNTRKYHTTCTNGTTINTNRHTIYRNRAAGHIYHNDKKD